MSCKGFAAAACPSATTALCVCSCGGTCHGKDSDHRHPRIRSATYTWRALIDALDILNLYYPILQVRRKRRKARRPRDHETLKQRLYTAGITMTGYPHYTFAVRASLSPDYAVSGIRRKLLEELIEILKWADQREGDAEGPAGEPPALTDTLRAEIERIMEDIYFKEEPPPGVEDAGEKSPSGVDASELTEKPKEPEQTSEKEG